MKPPVEVEIKIAVKSPADGRALLRKFQYFVEKPRVFEENLVLDDQTLTLFESGRMLRVRRAGKRVTCTSKGGEPARAGRVWRHKRRAESEFTASDFQSCLAVFAAVGFKERFRYEKFRSEYKRRGEPGTVTLDETPIGTFLELEGPPRWIDATARRLGFKREDYITGSYAQLYFDWCEQRKVKPSGMTFARKGA